jgi:TonB-dependent receptor
MIDHSRDRGRLATIPGFPFSMRIFLFLFAGLFPLCVTAQQVFSGRCIDFNSGEGIPGVQIRVKDSNIGAMSDLNGNFSIAGVIEDEISLIITQAGYRLVTRTVRSSDFVVFRLEGVEIGLEGVEIIGKAEGQIRAFLDQKNAESFKHVISAAQIATFPDVNAAEVIQRIPGISLQRDKGEGRFVQIRGTPPELTNFNINGEQVPSPEGGVRFVGLDIIPADQIETIEVSKVMTPDMDADGIGGSVNVKTKDANNEKPNLRFTMSGGYAQLRETPNYNILYAFSQKHRKIGFTITGSFLANNQGADNIEIDYAKGPFFGSQGSGIDNYFVQYREVQLRHYDILRKKLSVSPSLSFYLNPRSTFYIRAMYNQFSDRETRYRKIYELDDALSFQYYLYGGIVHDVKERLKSQFLSTVSIGGDHNIEKVKIDWQCMLAEAKEQEPDRLEASFESPGQAIAIKFELDDPEAPRATFPNPANAANATNYSGFELNNLLLENRHTRELVLTPRFNLTFPYKTGFGGKGYLKMGGKLRARDKRRDVTSHEYAAYFEKPLGYPGEGPELTLTGVQADFSNSNLLNKGIRLDTMPSSRKLRDFFEFYPQHFVYDRTATKVQSFGEDYRASERIWAAYTMARLDLGKFTFLAGTRFEHTAVNYQGVNVVLEKNKFKRIDTLTDARTHAFLLPHLQIRYSLNPQANLRLAYTESYSRPNFDDVLPYREQDRDEVKFGNPDLVYPGARNMDFLFEQYFSKGMLSAGLFYKQLDNFVFFYKRFAHEGSPADYGLVEITKAINGKRATLSGVELQYQAKFDFLPGIFRDFGVYTNYAYTHTYATITKRLSANYTNAVVIFGQDDLSLFTDVNETERIKLPGQATHTANFSIFYDNPRFMIRAAANYQDEFLFRLGADKDLDEFYGEALRLDFSANVDLTRQLKFFIDAINVTNTPLRYYLGEARYLRQVEYYSWWCRVGLKWNIQ